MFCGTSGEPITPEFLGKQLERVARLRRLEESERHKSVPVTRYSARCLRATVLAVAHFEGGDEGGLRDLDLAELAHPLFALLLLVEELAFAGHVAAVAFGEHVLAGP
jgi:hypothetical protein